MVGSLNSAMTAALLAIGVEVANFYGLFAAVLPLNLHIGLVHIDLPSPTLRVTGARRSIARPSTRAGYGLATIDVQNTHPEVCESIRYQPISGRKTAFSPCKQ